MQADALLPSVEPKLRLSTPTASGHRMTAIRSLKPYLQLRKDILLHDPAQVRLLQGGLPRGVHPPGGLRQVQPGHPQQGPRAAPRHGLLGGARGGGAGLSRARQDGVRAWQQRRLQQLGKGLVAGGRKGR